MYLVGKKDINPLIVKDLIKIEKKMAYTKKFYKQSQEKI